MGTSNLFGFCVPKDDPEDEVVERMPVAESFKIDMKVLSLRIQGRDKLQVFNVRHWLTHDFKERVTIFHSPYSTVGKFIDTRTGKTVAVKLIRKAKHYLSEIVNEVMILKWLNSIDQRRKYYPVLYDVWLDESNDTAYLCFEFFRYDIEQILLKMRKRKIHLEKNRIKYLMWNMLMALDLLKRAEIIHLDLKPQNFLASEVLTEVRLTDFGSARKLNAESDSLSEDNYTYGYVPMEVLVGNEYRYKADVFALGCVWWEMLSNGNRLIEVNPKLTTRELQIEDNIVKLVKRLGKLKDSYGWVRNPKLMQLAAGAEVSEYNPFDDLTDPEAGELLATMLALNPSDRSDLSEVVNHKYFSQFKVAQTQMYKTDPFAFQKPKSEIDLWVLFQKLVVEFTNQNARIGGQNFRFGTTEQMHPVGSNIEITM